MHHNSTFQEIDQTDETPASKLCVVHDLRLQLVAFLLIRRSTALPFLYKNQIYLMYIISVYVA